MMFPYPHRVSSVQLPVCDSFLNYGYFSLSFVKEREPHSRPLAGMSKAIPGRRSSSPEAAPPPARSSCIPASVIRCLCKAPEMRCCDIACNAALTRRPSHCGCRLASSAHARMRTACAARAAATGVRLLMPHTSLCLYLSFTCFSFLQPQCFPCPYRFSVQLSVCDSFLNCG